MNTKNDERGQAQRSFNPSPMWNGHYARTKMLLNMLTVEMARRIARGGGGGAAHGHNDDASSHHDAFGDSSSGHRQRHQTKSVCLSDASSSSICPGRFLNQSIDVMGGWRVYDDQGVLLLSVTIVNWYRLVFLPKVYQL